MTQARGLFLYGTLRHQPLLTALVGEGVDGVSAQLAGHEVVCWPGVHNPYLRVADGQVTEGLFLPRLSDVQRQMLDAYEVPFGYFPQAREVMLTDGTVAQADVYYPDPEVEQTDAPWSLSIWAERHGPAAVEAAREIAAHDPPLTPDELRRQWNMIQSRAESRVRARAGSGPATVRYDAQAQDVEVLAQKPLQGAFFKIAGMSLRHKTFGSGTSPELMREVLVGVDAALILPYDAARDRVMLVEQFRAGAARRGDPNPWSLEPVAGIVDAGETPEDAARREGLEEAGVEMTRCEQMFSMYPSPGSSTDHFFCFVGHCDLPSLEVGHGGLASENEDLRLHVMPHADAMALIDSGEANAGPLIAMLLWIERHKARLRTSA